MMRSILSYLKNEDGVAAVEGALVAPVFFSTLIMVFELLLFVFTSSSLDSAMQAVASEIRLGSTTQTANARGWDQESYYREALCERVYVSNCLTTITVNVETHDAITGGSSSIVSSAAPSSTLVYFEASIDAPSAGILSSLAGADTLRVTAAQVFITEPF